MDRLRSRAVRQRRLDGIAFFVVIVALLLLLGWVIHNLSSVKEF